MKKHWLYTVLLATTLLMSGCKQSAEEKTKPITGQALPIPQLVEDEDPSPTAAKYSIEAEEGKTAFYENHETVTMGYNGSYLGPVLRMRKGEEVTVQVKNSLKEATTVHWHGLEVEGSQDGGVHGKIDIGKTWNAHFTVDQPAATVWFHPHLMHKTGVQVYKGLAGMIYIEDEQSDQLAIPKEYGKDDFPLIVQDKRFTDKGEIPYQQGMNEVMHGFLGNTVIVNGAISPYLEVPKGKVRLRVLNGSNARVYTFGLSGDAPFWQIASDGGFLERPVQLTSVMLSPAERAEIVVDFSSYQAGEEVTLQNGEDPIMKFRVKDESGMTAALPETLVSIPKIDRAQAVKTRTFAFMGSGRSVNINGKQMDMNRIDETVRLGDTEIWEITNPSGSMAMGHPFHAHGVQFQILTRNGELPPENERGWKDTIYVRPDERVEAIATFRKMGTFMYHCHILEHEENGMMGQFEVKPQ